MTGYLDGLATLLRQRVNARVVLQLAQSAEALARAEAESRIYTELLRRNDLGKTVEDRRRQLDISLAYDDSYTVARREAAERQRDLWDIEAQIEILHDQRRAEETALKARLIDLIEAGRYPGTHAL